MQSQPSSGEAAAAVVLLSGGLDSSTVLALAKAQGYRLHALSFVYGQRHQIEVAYARRQATAAAVVAHEIVDLSHFGHLVARATSLVASSTIPVSKAQRVDDASIPLTYVPARNTLFLAYALGWAEVLQASTIYLGVNAVDYSGYPDCRPAFVDAFVRLANLATKAGVAGQKLEVQTPLIGLSKAEIIALGVQHGVDYRNTVSCYDPTTHAAADGLIALACGACESCQIRAAGFAAAGIADPTRYASA